MIFVRIVCIYALQLCLRTGSGMKIQGISKILRNYDVMVLDQWGVLHDGKKPYDGVIDSMRQIRENFPIKIIILSNSSKRSSSTQQGLLKVGLSPDHIDGIVTSGEIGWQRIRDRFYDFLHHSDRPLRVTLIGNADDDLEYIQSCGCILADPKDADFILARGSFSYSTASINHVYKTAEALFECIDTYLTECAMYSLPMLVTNPDTNRPGSNAPMPGRIGEKYSNKGMRVEYIGKPYSAVYDECYHVAESLLGKSASSLRFFAVGDSLEHDIRGAEVAGMDSVWIMNGVHCLELNRVEGSPNLPEDVAVESLLRKFNTQPTYSLARFSW